MFLSASLLFFFTLHCDLVLSTLPDYTSGVTDHTISHFTLNRAVVAIRANHGPIGTSYGTGYFYRPHPNNVFASLYQNHDPPIDPPVHVIVTNKHVLNRTATTPIEHCIFISFSTNQHDININGLWFVRNIHVDVPIFSLTDDDDPRESVPISITNDNVRCHPDAKVDLCVIALPAHMSSTSFPIPRTAGTGYMFTSFDQSHLPTNCNDLQSTIEDVIMIGCPDLAYQYGSFDQHGAFKGDDRRRPIARRGITATPFSDRHRGEDEGLIDIANFPGSSGSPVISAHRIYYYPNGTEIFNWIRLLGTVHSVPPDPLHVQHENGSYTNPPLKVMARGHLAMYAKFNLIEEILFLHQHPNPQRTDVTTTQHQHPDGDWYCQKHFTWQQQQLHASAARGEQKQKQKSKSKSHLHKHKQHDEL